MKARLHLPQTCFSARFLPLRSFTRLHKVFRQRIAQRIFNGFPIATFVEGKKNRSRATHAKQKAQQQAKERGKAEDLHRRYTAIRKLSSVRVTA